MATVTEARVLKLIDLIDAGLVYGIGLPVKGQMCIESAVCYALDLPHGDNPPCVDPLLRSININLDDKSWSNHLARAKGLKRLGIVQLDSKNSLDRKLFVKKLLNYVETVTLVKARIATIDKHFESSSKVAFNNANLAYARAIETFNASNGHDSINMSNVIQYSYLSRAVNNAIEAATHAAAAAGYAVEEEPVNDMFISDSDLSKSRGRKYIDRRKAYDKELAILCEGIVQILISMQVPGTRWLYLAPL